MQVADGQTPARAETRVPLRSCVSGMYFDRPAIAFAMDPDNCRIMLDPHFTHVIWDVIVSARVEAKGAF